MADPRLGEASVADLRFSLDPDPDQNFFPSDSELVLNVTQNLLIFVQLKKISFSKNKLFKKKYFHLFKN